MDKATDNNNYGNLCKWCGKVLEEEFDFCNIYCSRSYDRKGSDKKRELTKEEKLLYLAVEGNKATHNKETHKEEDKGCGKTYKLSSWVCGKDNYLCPKCKTTHNKDYQEQDTNTNKVVKQCGECEYEPACDQYQFQGEDGVKNCEAFVKAKGDGK